MKPTALGALVSGAAWLAITVGFLAGTWGPAAFGVAMLVLMAGARWHVRRVPLTWHRDMPHEVEVDEPFTVSTRVEGDATLWAQEPVPEGCVRASVSTTPGKRATVSASSFVASSPGTLRFARIHVEVGDPWGLWRRDVSLQAPGNVAVRPLGEMAGKGRAHGRRHTVQSVVKSRHAMESVPEMESVRPYAPGDKMRDIDWARSSRHDGLYSKIRERVMNRQVVVLLDAGPSMRWQKRISKLRSAGDLAYGAVAAAQAAGVTAKIVAFDEVQASHIHKSTGRLVEARKRLSALQSPVPIMEVPRAVPGGTLASSGDQAFLAAASSLSGGKAAAGPPIDVALAGLGRGQKAFVVAILDGEEQPELAEETVRRLAHGGHTVVLVVPKSGAHHYDVAEGRRHLDALQTWKQNRLTLQGRLRGLNVPVLALHPRRVDEVLKEVVTRAQ